MHNIRRISSKDGLSMECGVQLVEAGVNGSKPADTTAAAADLLTEMAALEQVWDPTPALHF